MADQARVLTVYIDYKSPYAYLALGPTRELAAELGLKLDWLPYSLRIENFLGEVESRNPHQWRRVKYSYMDARRLANERGLIVRGPKKLFDSTVGHVGLLFAKDAGADVLERYHDIVFEGFFKRELDIEVEADVLGALDRAGAPASKFPEYLAGPGRERLDRTLKDAEDRLGVFGVPTYVVDGEIFWGGDRIGQVRRRLEQTA
ncbi:MAG: DsbA family protein [Alphaproteobacteria bacterium]